jgi:hypothetical protein
MTTHAMTATPLVTRILHLPITTDAEAFVTVARATERVVVQLGNPGFENRDRLGRFVVRGIETELGRLGAAPPGWRYDDGIEAILSDQIYRVRLLGCAGLALSLPSLRDLADASGQLGAEDSNTLRQLVALAEREPLQLYIPRPCTELRVVGTTELLSAWLPVNPEPGRIASIEYDDPAINPSMSELAPIDSADVPSLAAPPLEAFIDGQDLPPTPTPPPVCVFGESTPRPPETVELSLPHALEFETPAPPSAGDAADTRAAGVGEEDSTAPPSVRAGAGDDAASPPEVLRGITPAAEDRRGAAVDGTASDPLPTPPRAPATAAEPNVDPQRIQRCLAWANQLRSMSGPKVHGSIEKAFITAYLPLCREIAVGVAPPEAATVADRWAEGFAQSYAAAFRQLASRTSRRPRMVKDVVDISVRWLGQHHARQCQLLLVSAMRFDLGQRLNEELEHRLTTRAVCVDQCVLWTALPSNADTQQLAAEAPAARRAPSEPPSRDAAPGIVPFSVGNRGLFRLEPVPAELSKPGEIESERLERLAATLADRVEPWILEQPPDTLIVIFGDHGFHWRASPRGTTAGQRGGALPEQVLVPASAWLLRAPRHKARVAPGIH